MQETLKGARKPARRRTAEAKPVAQPARASAPAQPALDPVDYAVISQALIAIAREMGTKLIRSSYSNIVREAQDYTWHALKHAYRLGMGQLLPDRLYWAREEDEPTELDPE